MRNSKIIKDRTSATLLLVLAACIIGLVPAFSTSVRADFSINDVSGNYVDHSERWDFGNGNNNFLPSSNVGLLTFTPATGTFHADEIGRVAGENHPATFDGTYTVDANGHGTMSFSGVNGPKHRDFYIVNGGAELKWINTDPPGTGTASASGTMTKH